jgi:hypothetical protein
MKHPIVGLKFIASTFFFPPKKPNKKVVIFLQKLVFHCFFCEDFLSKKTKTIFFQFWSPDVKNCHSRKKKKKNTPGKKVSREI